MINKLYFFSFLLLLSKSLVGQGLTFDSDGVDIHYEVSGQGEPVVLIHGFAVSGKINWTMGNVLEKLSANNRVILMDVRGHGRSGKPHDSTDYGLQMVEDVVRLLDHLKVERAHLAGYSMGGLIALKLATLHPQRLKSVSICGAAWLRPDEPEAPDFIAKVSKSLDEGNGPMPLLERLNPAQDAVTLARIRTSNSFLKLMNDCKALSAAIKSFPALAIAEQELVKTTLPVQFLIGSKDPAPTGVDQLKLIAPKNFRIIEIKDADHMTTIPRPEFYDSLSQFIEQNR